MMPVYRSMDSHPNQRNQMPFSQYCYPSFEAIPPHMKMDSFGSPVMYEYWPTGSNYGHSAPCHASCSHNNFPAYYTFRPPCPHFSPASSCHFCGNYPTFPEAYSVHYVPPPHYSMAQPRYEYDKDAPRNYHCCGCPNHTHDLKSEKGVKIEEQEPESEKKGSDSLVPIQLKNYPYPIVWIPPEYMKNKPFEPEVADQSKVLHDTKIPESLRPSEQEPRVWNGLPEQEPRVLNGWFPFDMNSLKSLMHGEDGKETQNQRREEITRQFPTPIIWMPSYNQQEEVDKKDNNGTNAAPKSAEESPNFKFTPAKLPDSDGSINKPRANEEKPGSQVGTKIVEEHSNQKNNPVKQMESPREKNYAEDTERSGRSVSVKQVEDIAADKLSETGAKRQSSSSPTTASKLPPVCLRVDPFPGRKNGNGSSRSPSPPGIKGQSQKTAKDTSNASALSSLKENSLHDKQAKDDTLKKIKKAEPNKKGTENIEVVDRRTSKNKDEDLRSGLQAQIPVNLPVKSEQEVSRKPTTERKGKDGDECKIEGGAGHVRDMTAEDATKAEEATDSTVSADGECRPERKNLSDVEAAVLIQSAYRGFEVRRWEPLKKLKQIAKVREQMFEVRNHIQTLESSSDLQKDDKQRVVIGEMIMSLLLKLDTIQGLHPSLRDIRKTLARELVTLQEKLDSLMTKKSKRSIEEAPTAKPTNDLSADTESDVSTLEMQNKGAAGVGGNQPESNYDSSGKMKEKERDHDQLLHITDVVSDSQVKEISETQSVDNEVQGTYELEIKETPVASGVECQVAEQMLIMESNNEAGNGESNDTQQVMTVIPEGIDVSAELESVQHPSVAEGKTCSEGKPEVAKVSTDDYQEVNKLKELPQGVIREESGVSKLDKNEEIGKEAVHGEVGSNLSNDSSSTAEVDNLMPNIKDAELNLLAELPVEVINGDSAVSLFQKHEHIETERDQVDQVPQSGEGESNVSVDEISPTEKAPAVSQLEQQPLESSDWAKVGSQTHEELPAGDTALEVEVEEPQGKEINNADKLSVVVQETQPVFSVGGKENSDEEKQNMIEIDHMLSSESAAWGVDTQVKGVLFEEKQKEIVDQPLARGKKAEEVQEKKLECQEPDVISNDKMANLSAEFETAMEVGTQSSAVHEKPGEEEEELLGLSSPSPSASQLVSLDEHNIWMERDKKLIEDNKKLREMMEKLMEAGKNQLNVISNLTERVKDLETKLLRKKKLKTRHHRKATSAISCAKPVNDTVKGRAVGVAM